MFDDLARADDADGAPRLIPDLVVFDLDETVWTPEMWETRGGFVRMPPGSTRVVDRDGTRLRLHPGAELAISEMRCTDVARWSDTQIAYASRTDHPERAREALRLVRACASPRGSDVTLEDAAEHAEIYPVRSKVEQFERLRDKTGVPYDRMLFFDNEERNVRDVRALGVRCAHCPGGMTERHWRDALADFAKSAARGTTSTASRKRTPSWGDRVVGDRAGSGSATPVGRLSRSNSGHGPAPTRGTTIVFPSN